MQAKETQMERIILGGGCFWCIEAVYERAKGVVDAQSGYSGGDGAMAHYEAVCSGHSGHAEVVQITYDPSQVDLEALLEIFWVIHDPTSLNAQGADRGTQYRSVVYYETQEQQARILASLHQAQKMFSQKIVTEVAPLEEYFAAEAYHQDYFQKNPNQGYCQAVVAPKVQKAKAHFSNRIQ